MRNPLKNHSWHMFVMILCFIYGGTSLFFAAMEIVPRGPIRLSQLPANIQADRFNNTAMNTATNEAEPNLTREAVDNHRFEARFSPMRYVIVFFGIVGAIVSVLAGTSLLILLKKKEKKELTKSILDTMTTPDEKLVIQELEENNGELTQSDLVRRTKLSKVKVHRVIKRLESLKVVSKYDYGVTNKIKLEKDVYEKKEK